MQNLCQMLWIIRRDHYWNRFWIRGLVLYCSKTLSILIFLFLIIFNLDLTPAKHFSKATFQIFQLSSVYPMRDIVIKISDKDYLDFQLAANNSGLRVDEKISEIIQYYIIIERNRKKFSQSTLFTIGPESWFLYPVKWFFWRDSHILSLSPWQTAFCHSPGNSRTLVWCSLRRCSKWCCKSRSIG